MSDQKIEFIVSACLAGEECRYDCQAKTNEKMVKLVKEGKALALCPEQLGELPTPRPPAEQQANGQIITNENKDVTENYQAGAQKAWELSKEHPIKKAYLKSKSPMCGVGQIYDGSFTGKLIKGNGVFTQLLKKLGIFTEPVD